jgi:hypothetical protein
VAGIGDPGCEYPTIRPVGRQSCAWDGVILDSRVNPAGIGDPSDKRPGFFCLAFVVILVTIQQ